MAAGYVYLMERIKGKSLYAKVTGQAEVKIGLSRRPKSRLEQVNESLKGKTVLVQVIKVPNMRRTEKFLHSMFSDSRFTQKRAGKGAGKTEWFFVTWAEFVALLFWFFWLRAWYGFLSYLFWAALAIAIIIIFTAKY